VLDPVTYRAQREGDYSMSTDWWSGLAAFDKRSATNAGALTRFVRSKLTGIGPLTLCFGLLAGPLAAETYYVDSKTGADSNNGLTPAEAWKSLERLNRQIFKPGDAIRFKAGTTYAGQFKPQGSGQLIRGKPTPIVVGKYGEGPRPRINGEGNVLDTVLLRNIEYWEIRDLEITNQGPVRRPWQTGVHIVAEGSGTLHHLYLRDLDVHDVTGDLRKSHEGCGIYFESLSGKESCFDDLRIENCHVARTDRNGICQRRSEGAGRSLGVIIRGNVLEDIGGDGIKPWGSSGALVERNVLRGGRMRCDDAAAGIWPWDCDDTVIQFNEVSGMHGIGDGQGFDSDFLCRRSIFQYNYSHNNDGGFMLICTPGDSYCDDTIIRYNISQNDGINSARVFHFAGPARNTMVYNNVIYVGSKQRLPLVLYTDWGGYASNTHFVNNIFYVDGQVTYDWGRSTQNVFENNVFFGKHEGRPHDPGARLDQPPLVNPGSGLNGFDSLGGYKLRAGAPFARGGLVPNNGGRDFFGNPVSAREPAMPGAFEEVRRAAG
jgi:Right handed beta helix region